MYWFFNGPSSQYAHGCSQLPGIPVPGDPSLSSGLCGDCMYVVYIKSTINVQKRVMT